MTRQSPRLVGRAGLPCLGAALAGALVGVGIQRWTRQRAATPPLGAGGVEQAASPGIDRGARRCPPNTLLDDDACLPLPTDALAESSAPALPLAPGRPTNPTAYVSPVPGHAPHIGDAGRGLIVSAPPGSPVVALGLEGQTGAARRLDPTRPGSALFLYEVARGDAKVPFHYLVQYRGLAAPPVAPTTARAGQPLGTLDADDAELRVTIRQVRRGVSLEGVAANDLLDDRHSLGCDVRNVIQLAGAAAPTPPRDSDRLTPAR